MSMNDCSFVGRLTADPELRYTSGNVAVCTATVAVNRNYKDNNGERKADFLNVVIWRKYGETFANYAKKGDLISVIGRAENNNYTDNNGVKHYTVVFNIQEWDILESRQSREARMNGTNQNSNNSFGSNFDSGTTPNFGRSENSPFGQSNPMDISDDDLPF